MHQTVVGRLARGMLACQRGYTLKTVRATEPNVRPGRSPRTGKASQHRAHAMPGTENYRRRRIQVNSRFGRQKQPFLLAKVGSRLQVDRAPEEPRTRSVTSEARHRLSPRRRRPGLGEDVRTELQPRQRPPLAECFVAGSGMQGYQRIHWQGTPNRGNAAWEISTSPGAMSDRQDKCPSAPGVAADQFVPRGSAARLNTSPGPRSAEGAHGEQRDLNISAGLG